MTVHAIHAYYLIKSDKFCNDPSSFNLEYEQCNGRRSGLMVSAFVPGASGPGWSPGRGHCVVFLGKTLHSHGASLHPGV